MDRLVRVYTKIEGYPEQMEIHTGYQGRFYEALICIRTQDGLINMSKAEGNSEVEALLKLTEIPWHHYTQVPPEGIK